AGCVESYPRVTATARHRIPRASSYRSPAATSFHDLGAWDSVAVMRAIRLQNAADATPNVGNPAWSRVLIVEGTSGVGKSTLIDQLIRRYVAGQPARKLRTILHLTQAHTYGPLAPAEDLGALTAEQNLEHLDDVVSMIEWHVSALT